MIIECPSCQSKFNLDDGQLTRDRVKLRCRICSQVFVYEKSSLNNLEQEFESLLTESESAALLKDQPEPNEEPAATEPEAAVAEEASPTEAEAEEATAEIEPKRRGRLAIFIAILALLGGGAAGGYYCYKNYFLEKPSKLTKPTILSDETAKVMSIDSSALTYELLPRENNETVLIIRGAVKRLSNRAVSSVLLEAKLCDDKGNLLQTKLFYAGIVPQKAEFIGKNAAAIDELLMAAPAAGSPPIAEKEIPFALAFFGETARKAATAQIEVKKIQWLSAK